MWRAVRAECERAMPRREGEVHAVFGVRLTFFPFHPGSAYAVEGLCFIQLSFVSRIREGALFRGHGHPLLRFAYTRNVRLYIITIHNFHK